MAHLTGIVTRPVGPTFAVILRAGDPNIMFVMYRTFRHLPRSAQRDILQAAVLMALAWTGLRVLRFRTVLDNRDRHIGVSTPPHREHEDEIIRRVQWAINAVAARCSWATCLVQALAADVMLRRRGIPSVLRFGVRPDDGRGGIEGHAWLECSGGVVVGAIHELSSYETMERASSIVDRLPTVAPCAKVGPSSIESLLNGELIPWAALRMTPAEFLGACSDRDVTCLIAEKLRTAQPADFDWPNDVRETLATIARAQAAKELVRQKELIAVLDALSEAKDLSDSAERDSPRVRSL